jgi:tetratricopeptide (TPR) repeat protein
MILEKLTKPLRDLFPLLLSCALISSGFSASAETPDFSDLSKRIRQQADSVDRLQDALGRHRIELVEPLYGLARIQLSANRFEEAKASADRALQIVRWTQGLESERQFPYLELIVDIGIARDDWDNVEDKLKHYTALLGQKYHGDARTRLGHMLWLANTHAQGAHADTNQRRAYHLMQATRVSEIAVQYAQARRLTLTPVYPELLFAVARAYDMENAVIRERGSVSYQLRELAPGTHILEERKVAITKRYQFGREKLLMMRDAIRDSAHFDDEALLASEIYLAAWSAKYEETADFSAALERIEQFALERGLNDGQINKVLQKINQVTPHRLVLNFGILEQSVQASGD